MNSRKLAYISALLAALQATSQSGLGQVFSVQGYAEATLTPSGSSPVTLYNSESLNSETAVTSLGSITRTGNGVNAVGSATGSWNATSNPFGLSVTATSSQVFPATSPNSAIGNFLGHGSSARAYGYSTWTIADTIFSGSLGATTASLNLNLDQFSQSGEQWTGIETAYITIFPSSGALISGSSSGTAYPANVSAATGLLESVTSGGTSITTGTFVVPTGVPITWTIQIGIGSSVSGQFGSSSTVENQFAISLPTTGNVFNLDPGYGVNATEFGILDNQYSPVPEVEEYALMGGIGLVAFAIARRRRN